MPILKVKTTNGWVAVGGGATGSSGSGTGGSSYTLPIANATTLGGVKPVSKTSEMTQAVGIDSEGRLYTKPGTGGSGSGGGGGLSSAYYVGATAPSDTGILWIDSGNSNTLKFYNGSAWVAVGAVWG